jgi:hypothetical protein
MRAVRSAASSFLNHLTPQIVRYGAARSANTRGKEIMTQTVWSQPGMPGIEDDLAQQQGLSTDQERSDDQCERLSSL